MANTFKKYTGTATEAGETVYTVGASTTAVIIGFVLANKSESSKTATVVVGGITLVNEVPIPAYASLSVLDGKIILEATDVVEVTASEDDAIDVLISVLEQT